MLKQLGDLLLAEAVRRHPDGQAWLEGDERARSEARGAGGSEAERLLHWIARLEAAQPLRHRLRVLRAGVIGSMAVLLIIAAVAGVGTGRRVLADDGTVDILPVLFGLVLIPLGVVLFWLVWTWVAPRFRWVSNGAVAWGSGLLGSLVLCVPARASGMAGRAGPAIAGAVHALLARSGATRWLVATASHAAWAMFLIAASATLAAGLAARGFDLAWSSTIVEPDTVAALVLGLAWLPDWLGFTTPDAAHVRAAGTGLGSDPSANLVMGRFLLLAILLYAVLPRVVAMAYCGRRAWTALAGVGLDRAHALFQRGLMMLREDRPMAVADARSAPVDLHGADRIAQPATAFGRGAYYALVGVELERPERWTAESADPDRLVLGHVQSRAELATVTARIQALDESPRLLLFVVSLSRSPDRGTMERLVQMADAVRAPVVLALAESERVQARGQDAAARIRDWRMRAERAGIAVVVVPDEAAQVDRAWLEAALVEAGIAPAPPS